MDLIATREVLRRLIDETPPNGPRNQQFKDSLIWEAVRELAEAAPVHLVTADKGFFEEGNYGKGLSVQLQGELGTKGFPVRIYPDLVQCLSVLATAVPEAGVRGAIGAIDKEAIPLVQDDMTASHLSLGSLDADGSEVVSFPLEQNDAVAVRFHLLHHCQRMRPDGQFIHGSLHVFGACRATPSKAVPRMSMFTMRTSVVLRKVMEKYGSGFRMNGGGQVRCLWPGNSTG